MYALWVSIVPISFGAIKMNAQDIHYKHNTLWVVPLESYSLSGATGEFQREQYSEQWKMPVSYQPCEILAVYLSFITLFGEWKYKNTFTWFASYDLVWYHSLNHINKKIQLNKIFNNSQTTNFQVLYPEDPYGKKHSYIYNNDLQYEVEQKHLTNKKREFLH